MASSPAEKCRSLVAEAVERLNSCNVALLKQWVAENSTEDAMLRKCLLSVRFDM